MKKETLKNAVKLGSRMKYALLATADSDGLPHVAAARKITVEPDGDIGVSEWFCPGTLSNLQVNPRLSIVVWDPIKDTGYQVLGISEKVVDLSMMNGYSQDKEKDRPLPQVERKIHVHVERIIHFSHGPHSDLEE